MQNDFREKINVQGVNYENMFKFLNSKAKEGQIGDRDEVLETELRDAL